MLVACAAYATTLDVTFIDILLGEFVDHRQFSTHQTAYPSETNNTPHLIRSSGLMGVFLRKPLRRNDLRQLLC